MSMTIGEMFSKIEALQTEDERVQMFRKFSRDVAFLQAVQLACDSRVVFDLPVGCPPLRNFDQRDGLSDNNLKNELKRMYIFLKDSPHTKNMSKVAKEQKFIHTLESFGPKDIKALCDIKDRKVVWLTKSLLEKAAVPSMSSVIPFFSEQETPQPAKKKRIRRTNEQIRLDKLREEEEKKAKELSQESAQE